jgi:hypothetical protein
MVQKIQIINIGVLEMTIFEMYKKYGYNTQYLKTA